MLVSVYCLVDPEVRYIGVTKHPLQHRLREHFFEAKDKPNSHKGRWITKMLREGSKISIVLIARVRVEEWQDVERTLIAEFRRKGARLINQTDGGEGARGLTHTEETKRKISESSKARYESSTVKFDSYSRTPEVQARRTRALTGKVRSAEQRERISKALTGRTFGEEFKQKVSAGAKRQWERQKANNYSVSNEHKSRISSSVSENWKKRREMYGPSGIRRKVV